MDYEEIMNINEETEDTEVDEETRTSKLDAKSTLIGALGTAAIYGAYRGVRAIVKKVKARKAEHVVDPVVSIKDDDGVVRSYVDPEAKK